MSVTRAGATGGGAHDEGMKQRVRCFDWAKTPLGAMQFWSSSLKTAVEILLNSRFPMVIYWGQELTLIYNDAWISIAGTKHPAALGSPGSTVFREIWHIIGPMFQQVMETGQATYSDDQLLAFDRSEVLGTEEAYFTWSYSAILVENGSVGGVFTAVTETTERVVGDRRRETLRALGTATTETRTVREYLGRAAQALGSNDADVPFAMIYLAEQEKSWADLAACVGCEEGAVGAPSRVALEKDWHKANSPWPIAEVLASAAPVHLKGLRERVGDLPGGRWPKPSQEALVLPVGAGLQHGAAAVMVIGISPYAHLNDSYRSFLDLAAVQIGNGISHATAYEMERRRAEALAELDSAKTAFFSNVSHEFRTPLTLMLGPIGDILDQRAELLEIPRQQMEVIHRNGIRLLKLVNNLLDFSRIEAGRMEPLLEETDLAEFTAELASVFRSAVEKAGLEFVVETPVEPVFALVDRDAWEKIVLNLLSNAFKFTFEGWIATRLRVVEGQVFLDVEDTGSGIPETELPHIFERFHRVPDTKARSYEGSGIGLAMVRELVKLHGGGAQVSSVEGRGTTFTISIPLRREPAAASAAGIRSRRKVAFPAGAYLEEAERWLPEGNHHEHKPAVRDGESRDGTVLLADDNADMRDYLLSLLSPDWRVTAVSSGDRALAEIESGALPDLVVLDVMMPGMDGFEILRRLRQNERTRTLPVILLSARAGPEARLEGLSTGADDYIVKPFTARELTARVRSQIELARARRMAELSLRAAKEHLSVSLEASSLGTWELDTQTGELSWDERTKMIFGVSQDADVTFAEALSFIHPEDRERMEKLTAEMFLPSFDTEYKWEFRIVQPGAGAVKHLVALGKSVKVPGGDGELCKKVVGTIRDVTDDKEKELALIETSKLESLGLLAGGIAHDFNNLLTGVIGNASMLAESFSKDSQEAETVESLMGAADRMARLTSQMLAYSGRGHFVIEPVDLSEQVQQITNLIQSSIPKHVQLRYRLAEDLPLIDADTGQLQQVIMNLIINAAEAVGSSEGEVEIVTGMHAVGEKEIRANAGRYEVPEGDYVLFRVTDNGSGMDPATQARIFDPFFTTKFTGRGLGLSSVIGIVRGHRALLNVESHVGMGTTFRVYFPTSRRRIQDEDAMGGELFHPGGRVLVVDDEYVVRTVAKTALEKLGYAVTLASDGREAVDRFRQADPPFDLVLLDMTMPTISGEETLARLRAIIPEIAVVAMSGYSEQEAKGRFGKDISGFLHKPFTANQLSSKVPFARRMNLQRRPAIRQA